MSGWIITAAAVLLIGVAVLFLLSVTARVPGNLRVRDGRLAPCPASPNCVCSQADDSEHWIAPLTVNGDVGGAMARLRTVVLETPRTVVTEETAVYLRVEFRSAIFRFVDDAEFWLEPEIRRIHLRSCSRAGHSDLGVNRQRAEWIRRAFTLVDRPASRSPAGSFGDATGDVPTAAETH